MLIQRLLAALVLIPIVIAGLFFLSISNFAIVMLVIFALSSWEWAQFLHFTTKRSKSIFTILLTTLAAIIYYLPSYVYLPINIFEIILLSSIAWWSVALVLVLSYPKSVKLWGTSFFNKLLFAFFTLMPFFIAMIQLRQINYGLNSYEGAYWLLYILVLVWATDSGAYFAGRLWGKHKLAPSVSPGKTIEGLMGGVASSIIIGLLVYYSHFFNAPFYPFMISSVVAIFASVLGDLTESMFKREANIKDSGHLIPGHGGILDRIDSLTAAMPIFAAFILYIFGANM
ncbi:phosphatidate cytidylyltransferase [Frischella perrara]|uniref:Phosphatidate cytidylyltransferase n=1 Tax=Frischella perrara TaxID=1267021 RepID=A0A0A7S4Q4_FRIPE|nr:phosphatidate cytidylyltransferase [Frischella perrara]AJA45827.1 CDP-diglyceride synthetase [Frischella perrara]PWV62638.1 phosphatidate cytidylyltransferase [Frischella perrara]PXY94482.1 CDP-diglyceride synthetase [Frischella perrara]